MLGLPSAPKLDVLGKLDPGKAAPDELRGQEILFGEGQCGACHTAPYYTDNLMHDLKIERFFKAAMINGLWETGDGPIKTFPLRGIKDSPPYMHDGRLLTLDDTVEFFNLILGTKLTGNEKQDLVAFLRAFSGPTPTIAARGDPRRGVRMPVLRRKGLHPKRARSGKHAWTAFAWDGLV
jgi:cytochrome c peroxidase